MNSDVLLRIAIMQISISCISAPRCFVISFFLIVDKGHRATSLLPSLPCFSISGPIKDEFLYVLTTNDNMIR